MGTLFYHVLLAQIQLEVRIYHLGFAIAEDMLISADSLAAELDFTERV